MGCDGNNIKVKEQIKDPNKEIKIQDPAKEEKIESNQQKHRGRRSSLRPSNTKDKLDPHNLLANFHGKKRHSVNFGLINTFQYKEMKAKFQESSDLEKSKKRNDEEHKQFVENRRKSIKNEFSLVKELMKKNKDIIEEDDDSDEEAKNNMNKNIEIGKEELNEVSSSNSNSNSNNNSENEK